MFRAELFNATHWADVFRRAGAHYVVPTSKHHEGYTLWRTPTAWLWNAVEVGPHRDLLAEIMDAVRAAGLHAGLYYSLFEWWSPIYLSDVDAYVAQVMLPQLRDVVSRYAPSVLWSDGDWEHNDTTWRSAEFLAWAFNEAPSRDVLVVNDRWGSGTGRVHGSFFSPEHSSDVVAGHKWELCTTIDVISWGFNRAATVDDYLTADALLAMLVRTVANGGNLLLDVGPAADGTIPAIQEERLLQMGAWLDVHGEAIYATHRWRQPQEGADIDNTTARYTQSKDNSTVYAHVLQWPLTGQLVLSAPVIQGGKQVVTMLGLPGALSFAPLDQGRGVRITMPVLMPGHPMLAFPIWVIKLVGFV